MHCPDSVADSGVGGVSFFELLILYELWARERLVLEKAVPRNQRPGRPISVSAVLFGPGIAMLALTQYDQRPEAHRLGIVWSWFDF